MRHPFTTSRAPNAPLAGLLSGLALLACWLVTSLLYALLAQPASTLTTLDAHGTRGVPVVMWSASRDLVRWLRDGQDGVRHD